MADEAEFHRSGKIRAGLIVALGAASIGGVVTALMLSNRQEITPPPEDVARDIAEQVVAPSEPEPAPAVQTPRPPEPPDKEYPLPALQDRGGGRFDIIDSKVEIYVQLPEPPDGHPVLPSLLDSRSRYFADTYTFANRIYDYPDPDDGGRRQLPYKNHIEWEYTARANGWVSLFGVGMEWVGQAHPQWDVATIIAMPDGKKIKFEDMLREADYPPLPLAIAVCEAVKAEKVRKGVPWIFLSHDPIVCAGPEPNISIGHVALAPSDLEGKFGGIRVYYEPYLVGSYAEGLYAVTVQQNEFAKDLKPEYRDLFGGTAPPLPPMN